MPSMPLRSNQPASSSSSSSSPSSCYSSSTSLARTFRNWDRGRRRNMVMQQPAAAEEAWSMSSLLTALPESPSPICSHASSARTPHFLSQQDHDATQEFSSPRNQSFGIANNENNNNNSSNCFSDIDEWLEHANRFCKPSNSHTNHLSETVSLRRNASPVEEQDLRISAVCSTFLTAPEHELHNIALPSIREESPVFQGSHARLSCMYGPSKSGSNEHRRLLLLSRTRPYGEFLSDAARKKHEVEREARNKAMHVEIMHRMKRKEDAIDNWELQQTRKAMNEMDKIQNELERKQLRASAKVQKKICSIREKAEKQKLSLRRSTMKRLQQLQKSGTDSPTENSWGSRLPLC